MIIDMNEKLEELSAEEVVDRIDSLLKNIVTNLDKIILRNKQGFEELQKKGIYVLDKKYNNSY